MREKVGNVLFKSLNKIIPSSLPFYKLFADRELQKRNVRGKQSKIKEIIRQDTCLNGHGETTYAERCPSSMTLTKMTQHCPCV